MNTTLTKAQASQEFAKRAKAICLENSIDYALAWHQAKAELPDLYATAFGDSSLAESRITAGPAARDSGISVAIPNAANIEALGLPRDATYDEFMAAHRAAQTVAADSPLRKNVIFTALVKLYGCTPAAETRAREFFLRAQ